MRSGSSLRLHKPRELRRSVVVPARLRHGAGWSDACIVNVSSRGMLIHTSRPLAKGSEVEIRRGDQAILARVVWRDGARAGLQAQDRVPVEQILTIGQAAGLQLTAPTGERRREQRPVDHSRFKGRAIEFASATVIAIALASASLSMVHQAFARPLAAVSAALGR